uniref:Uncharacterized protein n=1 Tax=Moniliophthora roreri TaxID=221103 RepID=A0A0W0G3M0_MONRR
MALEGRPRDWLQKNCLFIELEERPGDSHPTEKRFYLLGGDVASRQWIIDRLKEDGDNQEQIDDYKNDVRAENVLQIVIKAPHGLLRILWFGIADWEKTRKGKKYAKHMLDIIDRYWLDDLADALDKGDTTAYENLMKRMVIRQIEEEQAGMHPVYIDSEQADELVREMEEPHPKPDVNPERRAKEAQRRKAKKQRQKERRKAEGAAATSPNTDETVLEEVD